MEVLPTAVDVRCEVGDYLHTGKANYDQFFHDAAILRYRLRCINQQVAETGAALATTTRTTASIDPTKPDSWVAALDSLGGARLTDTGQATILNQRVDRLGTLLPVAEQLPAEASTLLSTGSGLLSSVNQDFSGVIDKLKIPAVTREVTTSVSELRGAAAETAGNAIALGRFLSAWRSLAAADSTNARH